MLVFILQLKFVLSEFLCLKFLNSPLSLKMTPDQNPGRVKAPLSSNRSSCQQVTKHLQPPKPPFHCELGGSAHFRVIGQLCTTISFFLVNKQVQHFESPPGETSAWSKAKNMFCCSKWNKMRRWIWSLRQISDIYKPNKFSFGWNCYLKSSLLKTN